MTPERIEQERKAFEAWMAERYPTDPKTEREGDEYSRLGTQYKWEGWQAKAAQLEWISVEDRLPDECNMVFIWLGGDDVTLSAYDSICGWAFIDQMDAKKVKCWSPVVLPDPPETRGK